MADAVEAARQHVEEEAADELVGRERHGLEPVAAFGPIVLTWGASGQGGDSFMRPPARLFGSVRLFALCQRRSIFRRWLLAAKMASARRGSRMRSTGEAGVRGAHVLDARLALAETCRQERVAHRTTSDRSSSYFYISVSRSGAQLPDAARFRARSTSHPVAARDGCTNIPLTAGRGSGERNHSSNRHFSPWTTSVRTPGSARTDQVLGDLRIC